MAIDINIPIEDAVTDGSLNPVTSNAVFDGLALKANSADLATVATSGDYNDLDNLPTIPAAQVNADWNATSGVAEILNKPTIPSVTGFVPYTGATNDVDLGVHDLTATQGVFATSGNPDTLTVNHSSGSGKALTITKGGNGEGVYVNKTSGSGNAVTVVGDLEATNLKRTGGTSSQFLKANGSVDSTSYQPTLVSATNIKTVNGNSLLGSGDLVISGGGGAIAVGTTAVTSGTVGRVFFQETGDVVQQDSGFTWDNINKRLLATALNSSTLFSTGSALSMYGGFNNRGRIDLYNGTTGAAIDFYGGGTQRMRLDSSGTLVIGATTAGARLDVRAQGALSTDIAFRVRNSADTFDIIRARGDGNVFIGLAAGDGSTGSNNVFFGGNAGRDSSGSNNVFIGFTSGRNNTTGIFNSFVGDSSGLNNTTGITNAYTGAFSMSNNTTGGSNIAFGFNSGRYIADGTTANTITNNSVFLGTSTRALANNQTNQIVIGHNAIGAGSNTATIGNTSIVKTILRGTLNAANLPTSPAGLVTGDIWNNLGILTIV